MQYNAAAAPGRAGRAHPSAVIGYCQVPRIYAYIPTRIYACAHTHTHTHIRVQIYIYIGLGTMGDGGGGAQEKENFFTRAHTPRFTFFTLCRFILSLSLSPSVFLKLNRFVLYFLSPSISSFFPFISFRPSKTQTTWRVEIARDVRTAAAREYNMMSEAVKLFTNKLSIFTYQVHIIAWTCIFNIMRWL